MILALFAAAGLCVYYVAGIRGAAKNSTASVTSVFGNANIERRGVGYTLKESTALTDGDIIETLSGSKVVLALSDSLIMLDESTELSISSAAESGFVLHSGCVLVRAATDMTAKTVCSTIHSPAGSVFSLSAQSGADTLFVYSGECAFSAEKQMSCAAKNAVTLVQKAEGEDISTSEISAAALSDFLLSGLSELNKASETCFSDSVLAQVASDRAQELALAAEERRAAEAALISQGGNIKIVTNSTAAASVSDPDALSCTISISCKTILDNMDNLTEGKGKYVPANGVILASSLVQFSEGDTAFDVLKAVCDYSGIQLEYSWTPMYNSYYVEGINNLYEFDCGELSGWMYKVNGWFPNYGASSYKLKAGDVISWCYTCNDLGGDVGAGDWMQ